MWISVNGKYALNDDITLPHQLAHYVRSLVAASVAVFFITNFSSSHQFYMLGLYIMVYV